MTEWIITSSALILVVIALRGLLKQRLRPLVRYALWALVLVRLLVPFSFFQSAMSLGNVAQDIHQQTGTAVQYYETTYDQVIRQYEQKGVTVTPAQARDEARQQVYSDTYASLSDRYAKDGVSVPEAQIQQEAQQQANAIGILALVTDALPVIWYIGMALMALALLGSNAWFAWKLRRASTPIPQPGFPLPVYETHYAATPCLFGLVRPGVYLTAEAAKDSVMRRHVLAHELTHCRHGDHIWSVLRGICLILHWYNPLVWAAALLSKRDAELACDEATIRALGEDERIAYGKTLIGMTCVRHDPKSILLTATTMIGTKKTLKERVRTIARKPKNALYAVIACVLVLSMAVGCTFTGATTAPGLEPGETVPTPTGYPEGQLQRSLIWYEGSLYIDMAEVPGDSVPDHYRFSGLISHEDPTAVPEENLHACHVAIGTDVYADPDDSSYIYYWEHPHEDHRPRRMQRFDLTGLTIDNLTGEQPTEPTTEPVTEPSEPDSPPISSAHLYPFIYSDDPGWDYWREYIGQNDCIDGYLYVQDRTTMEITLVLDTPVVRFTETPSHLFCVTQDGRILQVDYSGENQQTLYQASGEVSDIFHLSSKLYFNDGTELTVLDLDTLNASVVGSFTDYQSIYAVTETWLWLKAQGKDYAYDTVTGKLVLLYTGEALDRFLAGHWPEAPDTGVDLPENYTLAELVTSYEETLTWTERGITHETTFSIPVIYPFSANAVYVQAQIDAEWLPWLEEQRICQKLNTDSSWEYIRYEAALNGDLLSIVIDVYWTASGIHDYRVYNLDLTTGAYLGPAEMANRFLHISYPEFLMAVSEYRMDKVQATQPNVDMRAAMAKYAPGVSEMDEATLYLDKDGNLCLHYIYMDIAGAMFFPTVTPFSLEQVDWEAPTEWEAYAWLFSLYQPEQWRDSTLSDYWTMLQNAYIANPVHFEGPYSQMDDEELKKQIWDLVMHDDPTKNP